MGVGDFWQEIDDCRGQYETSETGGVSLEGFGKKFYEIHKREPILAVDLYLTFFQNREAIGGPRGGPIQMNMAESQRIQKASFFNICSNFLEAGIKIVLVCDGKDKPAVKRLKKRYNYTKEKAEITAFKEIAKSLNIPVVDAAGEGEAQCAHMQRYGPADFAYTEDSDVIIFGARKIVRKLKKSKGKDKDKENKDSSSSSDSSDSDKGKSKTAKPKQAVEARYAIYEIPDDHKWASPQKLLCYAILRGGDYSTGGKFIADVYASAIAQGGDWAERLYQISLFDPKSNIVFERPKKEKQLRQWAKDLQAEIVQKPIPVMSKNGTRVLQKTIVPKSDLFKHMDRNIGSNAKVVAPELANVESYATPKLVKSYSFSSVGEFTLDHKFFRGYGKDLGWINKEGDDTLWFKRMARPQMVRFLKDNNHSEYFTFINQRDKSCDKDNYSIEYCPYYIVQYPNHKCTHSGKDACRRMKSSVSASILMQSKHNYKQAYIDLINNPPKRKAKKTSSMTSEAQISSFYTVTKPHTPSPSKSSRSSPDLDIVVEERLAPETVSSPEEIIITDEKPASYDGKFGYGDDFDWDMALGKGSRKPALKQSALPGLSRPTASLSRKPANRVSKTSNATKASKARKQSTLSFLSSKSSSIEEQKTNNYSATVVLSDTEESTEEDQPETINLDSSPLKVQRASRIDTRDSQNQFSQNFQTFTSSEDFAQVHPTETYASPPEPELIELSD
ncbi:Flap endonuclease 1 [Yarrowia sp. C11]|nr:Flap endonuclease 1 [Yarrowia sp. C11]KAG5370548.1 Flap endonuclease 1 [Yarrowia sp. E02]